MKRADLSGFGLDYYSQIGREFQEREDKFRGQTNCFKTCSRCGETKPIFEFSTDKRILDGRTNICKTCRNQASSKYYYHNRVKMLKLNKEYRKTNKRDRSIYSKKYQKEHKEELRKKARKWYKSNKKAIKKRNLKYYQENKEACQARRELWIERNKEKIREYNREYNKNHRRRLAS
ncbi:hypothetical protein E3V08_02450 [Candidatus Atribacteria bacterium MT.SAG.1]|nr:hypothetical protein E3V08_02450 [Candidatus Atribacteria bacterium MT.SAG.1]